MARHAPAMRASHCRLSCEQLSADLELFESILKTAGPNDQVLSQGKGEFHNALFYLCSCYVEIDYRRRRLHRVFRLMLETERNLAWQATSLYMYRTL